MGNVDHAESLIAQKNHGTILSVPGRGKIKAPDIIFI